jgi:hypothetical protein
MFIPRQLISEKRSVSSNHLRIGLFALGVVFFCVLEAQAQLFGSRQMGNPLIRQSAPGGGEFAGNIGMVQGNERFIRGNRRASDFVGADNREAQGFVGQVNAANLNPAQIPTTLGTPQRANRAPQINRPAQRHRPNTLHYPTLELGFQPEPEALQRLAASAAEQIAQSLDERFGSRIEVSVEERTAILRGEVDSADASRLAELMAGFEPGVSSVRNELRVNSAANPSSSANQGSEATAGK